MSMVLGKRTTQIVGLFGVCIIPLAYHRLWRRMALAVRRLCTRTFVVHLGEIPPQP